jgi:MFS family permease
MNNLERDTAKVLAAQAVRAFAYGFGAVLLGTSLDDRGVPGWQVGVVLGAIVAGTAIMSVLIARYADRVGRRRSYAGLYAVLGIVGVVFATNQPVWLLATVALAGVLSTEVIESGPFTSLEQPMLAAHRSGRAQVHGFGLYNAVAAASGSLGALAAAAPAVLSGTDESRWFLVFVPIAVIGIVVARSLSADVEPAGPAVERGHLERSRPVVVRLASLFALDSFGGGFVVSAFVAYWLRARFDASAEVIGVTFFAIGLLQTASFLAAPRLAVRFGLLATMVFTHLPSNL